MASTSAVCVTGLTVVDTATHFTFWGQAWILLFIQLGGIGIITLSTMIIGALGARLSLRSEMLTMMPTRKGDQPEVWRIALSVLKFSLLVEAVGAILLFGIWAFEHPIAEAAWHALFHAISAYCNAGFTTFSDSMLGERNLVDVIAFDVREHGEHTASRLAEARPSPIDQQRDLGQVVLVLERAHFRHAGVLQELAERFRARGSRLHDAVGAGSLPDHGHQQHLLRRRRPSAAKIARQGSACPPRSAAA